MRRSTAAGAARPGRLPVATVQARSARRPVLAALTGLTGLAVAVVLAGPALAAPASPRSTAPPAQPARPFAAGSPWNTPLGTGRTYRDAGLGRRAVGVEPVLVAPAAAGARACSVSDAFAWLVLVDTDARTATARRTSLSCSGSDLSAATGTRLSLRGTGMPVPRVGRVPSVLPPPGGAVTPAELAGDTPLRHALALTLPGRGLPVGTLLAVSPRGAAGLTPRTPAARRLLAALRDYGAYVTATGTARTALRLRVDFDHTARPARTGALDPPRLDAPTRADLAVVVGALAVVTRPPGASAGAVTRTAPAPITPGPSTPSARPPVAVAAGPVAQVTPPRHAPAGTLWALAGVAVALFVAGLRAGRRLTGPAR